MVNSSSNYLVSILIPIKNPGKLFYRVLNAVLNQKTNFEYELIIIDSGSTDNTIEMINNLSEKNVRLIEIKPDDFGHGKTRNFGVNLSSAKYCAFLTHDATPFNQYWLSESVSIAEKDEDIAGVFGRHVAYEKANFFTTSELNNHFNGFVAHKIVKLDNLIRYETDLSYKQFLHFFSDNNSLIRRSIWMKIPYPDVNFAEDQLWAKAIIEAGYKKAYADKSIVYHSHNYTLKERLQRSFDESNAFYCLFGYTIMPSLLNMFKIWFGINKSEIANAIHQGVLRENLLLILKQPLFNFMKCLGMYLGSNKKWLSSSMKNKLSYDKKLFDGLRSGNDK